LRTKSSTVRASGATPIDQRDAQRAAAKANAEAKRLSQQSARLTLLRAARAYHERVIEKKSRNEKHAAQWIASIEGSPQSDNAKVVPSGAASLDAA
jgi:pyruvate-formate lyase